jgi:hypothetical protein
MGRSASSLLRSNIVSCESLSPLKTAERIALRLSGSLGRAIFLLGQLVDHTGGYLWKSSLHVLTGLCPSISEPSFTFVGRFA